MQESMWSRPVPLFGRVVSLRVHPCIAKPSSNNVVVNSNMAFADTIVVYAKIPMSERRETVVEGVIEAKTLKQCQISMPLGCI